MAYPKNWWKLAGPLWEGQLRLGLNWGHDQSERPQAATPAGAETNPTTGGYQISDELWEVLEPLIVNNHRFGGGRPRVPDRTCANGIFYVLRTGCQWKALDANLLRVHRPPAISAVGCRRGVPGVVAGGTGTLRRGELDVG